MFATEVVVLPAWAQVALAAITLLSGLFALVGLCITGWLALAASRLKQASEDAKAVREEEREALRLEREEARKERAEVAERVRETAQLAKEARAAQASAQEVNIAKAEVVSLKLDKTIEGIGTVHSLANSAMEIALKAVADFARRAADESHRPSDEAVAIEAEKKYEEHRAANKLSVEVAAKLKAKTELEREVLGKKVEIMKEETAAVNAATEAVKADTESRIQAGEPK